MKTYSHIDFRSRVFTLSLLRKIQSSCNEFRILNETLRSKTTKRTELNWWLIDKELKELGNGERNCNIESAVSREREKLARATAANCQLFAIGIAPRGKIVDKRSRKVRSRLGANTRVFTVKGCTRKTRQNEACSIESGQSRTTRGDRSLLISRWPPFERTTSAGTIVWSRRMRFAVSASLIVDALFGNCRWSIKMSTIDECACDANAQKGKIMAEATTLEISFNVTNDTVAHHLCSRTYYKYAARTIYGVTAYRRSRIPINSGM